MAWGKSSQSSFKGKGSRADTGEVPESPRPEPAATQIGLQPPERPYPIMKSLQLARERIKKQEQGATIEALKNDSDVSLEDQLEMWKKSSG